MAAWLRGQIRRLQNDFDRMICVQLASSLRCCFLAYNMLYDDYLCFTASNKPVNTVDENWKKYTKAPAPQLRDWGGGGGRKIFWEKQIIFFQKSKVKPKKSLYPKLRPENTGRLPTSGARFSLARALHSLAGRDEIL